MVWLVAVVGCGATAAGVCYSFATPWIDVPTGTWMTWLGSISAGCLVVALLVHVFGRRAAAKLSAPDALAHLAVLDRPAEPATEPTADEPLAQA